MPNILEGHKTQNLYEAAFLRAHGFKLAGKERSGQKVTIVFAPDPSINDAVMDFYNGGHVEGQAFVEAYRTLKDLVFER